MPVPDLPVELWMQIVLHLTPNDATKLMGVNRTLFQLALDFKYKELCLLGTSPDQVRSLERLGDKAISHRVRDFFPQLYAYGRSTGRSSYVIPFSGTPVTQFLKKLAKQLAHCSNVRKVTITSSNHPILPAFEGFLSSLWKTLGRQLLTLSVRVRHEDYKLLLTPARGKLANLQILDIKPSKPVSKAELGPPLLAVFEFASSCKSLTQLSLLLPSTPPLGANPDLFARLHLPKLTTLRVTSYVESGYVQTLVQDLGLRTLVPNILPNLQHLFIQNNVPWTDEGIRVLLRHTKRSLVSLELSLVTLTASILDIIAANTPLLTFLVLSYSSKWWPDGDANELKRISSRRYSDWPLEFIRVGPRLRNCLEVHPRANVAAAVAETVRQRVDVDLSFRCGCPHNPGYAVD
ncbi:hypothetical protein BKA70DRAFT_1294034 [Coprinopsis sp. MPI-PUGE-AT-0042]|nr:hypothetical protein BKA70DRAFT_1294034 [Coprinopsis sp. MPI-PUGE-AT-0042]